MFKHVLLPTDGSKLSEQAIKRGVAFAKEIKAKVTGLYATLNIDDMVFHDWDTNPLSQEHYKKIIAKQAKKYLAAVERIAKDAGVPCECLTVENRAPFAAIVKTAQDKGCDLIFMASHGRRGIKGLLLGSETSKVLTHCKIPVLVCR